MAITNGYCTLSDVKSALRITDSVDDTLLEGAVESASRLIDGYAMRNFYQSGTVTRYFATPDPLYCQVDDIAGTAVTIESNPASDGTWVTWAVTDYQLEPLNGTLDGIEWAYDRIRAIDEYVFPTGNQFYDDGEALVRVTGVFGWPSVPKAIETATIIQATRIFKRYDSPLGVAGF
ncbi:MAG: head-tail connector protein, partial [Steroidobacteraceae bacterium]